MPRQRDERRHEFIAAAADVFEAQGVANTTVRDVTEHMGVARSLFYYYFQDKDDLVDAVIDEYVDDFIEHVSDWIHTEPTESTRAKLTHIVALIRSYLMETNPFKCCIGQKGDASLLYQFTFRSAKRLSEFFEKEVDYSGGSRLTLDASIRHPRESYYLLVVGLIGLFNEEPSLDDEVTVDLICDTLHIPV